ncbi:Mannan endo-1,6-alpha-mannosidase DCW1 [Fulvia fulva]|uniref:mannan endo-1,6-alpha-mannosidase n=1 Tax=Passalora fulva TaxID=5499 RepID=A0A9Q8LFT9_PASFU|nr:Mannan endo-1,6-alpha-mannosidase DCW1 [Fulvia fulva]KAK4627018.1 Mannan endo-1,6-alpha-mannosidase DCW1 [Fulvia fulva]KAK4628225.1 Mannan endo-1,6-alpha-mannosidase DCW1 [Fulvia fulva]UJO16624.1 Mannan endo-1,6-alpha-mannosidase DCW1 [Fulvia fulva]WPV13853.1 Mannan endo-1,6-alpha-mannosidase DCW1 [Fulvia fulva]WPV28850.1 Mannan endo-1,6-alpha-mannosidase DCW1 [Fulvia fulva]
MLGKHIFLVLVSASAALSEKLDLSSKDVTVNSAKALVAPIGESTLPAAFPWISASSYTTVLHYWHYTGDSQYNDKITQKILTSAGGNEDFLEISPGNDDQLWWGLACITAAEYGVSDLTKPTANGSGGDKWLEMAQNVFTSIASRWQADTCGGMGWQVANSGYRNSITNGLAFQLAARLSRYTGKTMYTDWANKIWDWAFSSGLIDQSSYSVYDGISAPTCDASTMDRHKWSYNVGVYLYGTAIMLESTGDNAWQQHLDGLIGAAKTDFTRDDVLIELTCESAACNQDQQTFKATLARWLALTSRLVPDTADKIQPILDASAEAALSSCNDQSQCSLMWTARTFQGSPNLGAQMAAVEIIGAQLTKESNLPMKATSNGAASTSDTASMNGTTPTDGNASLNGTAATDSTAPLSTSVSTSDTFSTTLPINTVVPTSVQTTIEGAAAATNSALTRPSPVPPTSIDPANAGSSPNVPATTATTVPTVATSSITPTATSTTPLPATGLPATGVPTATDASVPTLPTSTIGTVSETNIKRVLTMAFTA